MSDLYGMTHEEAAKIMAEHPALKDLSAELLAAKAASREARAKVSEANRVLQDAQLRARNAKWAWDRAWKAFYLQHSPELAEATREQQDVYHKIQALYKGCHAALQKAMGYDDAES